MIKPERRSSMPCGDPETNRDYFDIVTGKKDYIGEALMLRANHRVYRSRGIQSKGEYRMMLGRWLSHRGAGRALSCRQ